MPGSRRQARVCSISLKRARSSTVETEFWTVQKCIKKGVKGYGFDDKKTLSFSTFFPLAQLSHPKRAVCCALRSTLAYRMLISVLAICCHARIHGACPFSYGPYKAYYWTQVDDFFPIYGSFGSLGSIPPCCSRKP